MMSRKFVLGVSIVIVGFLSVVPFTCAQPGVDENIVIDILQPLPPWGGTYRMWDNNAGPSKSVTFICSQPCSFLRVEEEAFNTCDVTGGGAATSSAAILCTPGDSPITNTPSFGRTPGTYYWISLTNGTGERADRTSEPGLGGACSQGAKARVEIMQKNPVNEALYNCTGITCTSTRLCHTLDCAWGRCMDEARAENMPDGTACDDGNPLTPDDECGNGFCAGTDDYWFTVLVNATTPLSTGAMSLSQEDGVANSIQTCSGVSGFTYVSDVISSPLLATVNFSLPTYREFGANALDDSLLQCVGTLLSFRGSTCSVEDIPFVSETETPAPTQAPTTAAPTDTPTSSAPTQVPTDRPTIQPTVTGGTFFPTTASPTKPGDTLAPSTLSPTTVAQGLPSSSNKESSFTSSVYFYGAAGMTTHTLYCSLNLQGSHSHSHPLGTHTHIAHTPFAANRARVLRIQVWRFFAGVPPVSTAQHYACRCIADIGYTRIPCVWYIRIPCRCRGACGARRAHLLLLLSQGTQQEQFPSGSAAQHHVRWSVANARESDVWFQQNLRNGNACD
eukprot:m.488986 g.488986  ORF g.488986 m.488986 type:complete len:561 (+) comp21763_c2_seq4:270-1952(+)